MCLQPPCLCPIRLLAKRVDVWFYTTSIIYKLNFSCYDDDVIKKKAERTKFRKGKRHDYNESFVLFL